MFGRKDGISGMNANQIEFGETINLCNSQVASLDSIIIGMDSIGKNQGALGPEELAHYVKRLKEIQSILLRIAKNLEELQRKI